MFRGDKRFPVAIADPFADRCAHRALADEDSGGRHLILRRKRGVEEGALFVQHDTHRIGHRVEHFIMIMCGEFRGVAVQRRFFGRLAASHYIDHLRFLVARAIANLKIMDAVDPRAGFGHLHGEAFGKKAGAEAGAEQGRAAFPAGSLQHVDIVLAVGGGPIIARHCDDILAGPQQPADIVVMLVHRKFDLRHIDDAIGVERQYVFNSVGRDHADGLASGNITRIAAYLGGIVNPESDKFEIRILDDLPQAGHALRAGRPLHHPVRHFA